MQINIKFLPSQLSSETELVPRCPNAWMDQLVQSALISHDPHTDLGTFFW